MNELEEGEPRPDHGIRTAHTERIKTVIPDKGIRTVPRIRTVKD